MQETAYGPHSNYGPKGNRKLKDIKKLKEVKKFKKLKNMKDLREYTVFHMAPYDIECADKVRQTMHEYHLNTINQTNGYRYVAPCFEAIRNFYVIFKYAVSKNIRKDIDKKFKEVREKLYNCGGEQLTDNQMLQARDDLFELIDLVYEAKQQAGLGIPKEKFKDAETALNEVITQ